MVKRAPKPGGGGKKPPKTAGKAATNGSMKMTMYTAPTMAPRAQVKERRPGRPPSGKRLALARNYAGKARSMARRSLDPCDNSNDSGLGFDHHQDHHTINMTDRLNWTDERAHAKRPRIDIKLENDEVNDNYSFPEHMHTYRDDSTTLIRSAPSISLSPLNVVNSQQTSSARAVPRCVPLMNRPAPAVPITLTTQLQASSRYLDVALSIIYQPEQQHRARYQTEGSRGAVKDRSGNGFPVVQLTGYNKPATLQVFIGSDLGKVTPHMFYQACRVSGKNSTPCNEKKLEGTIVIELQLDPTKDMIATCDCVGILKERNVDVEHRFPDQLASRSKKKSTRCRMVFRTTITHDDGMQETLQVCSQPIVCTQPPGIPEISKKSLTSCPASGGLELFIIGKNFLKDTHVYFQSEEDMNMRWEQSVVPDKEFLQQTHLVCVVPPYMHPDITEPVTVRLYVGSSGKTSEAHQFVYTPVNGAMPSVPIEQPPPQQPQPAPFLSKMLWMTKQEQDVGMMPPPGTNLVPLSQRRSSTTMISPNEVHSPPMHILKQELMDENSQNSVMDPSELRQGRYRHISESSLDVHQGDSNMSMINDNSIDMLGHGQIMQNNMNENSNMSIVNEGSMDMLVNRAPQICTEDANRCSSFSQAGLNVLRQNGISTIEDLKVMDLRMKMPMATVADLVNTNAPSLATLQSFGVTECSTLPLPAQSAQSVENYLINIENKSQTTQVMQAHSGNILSTATQQTLSQLARVAPMRLEPAFLTQQTPLLQLATAVSTEKSETAAIGEQTSTLVQTQVAPQTIESGILPTPITTEKLDALVNCAVDTHMSPQKDTSEVLLTPLLTPLLNSSPQLTTVLANSQTSPNIPAEVILNTQISPSLMCRGTTQDALSVETALTPQLPITTAPLTITVTNPENAILLNAAADLLATQKKLSNYQSEANIMNILTTTTNSDALPNLNQMPNTGNNFYTTASSGATTLIATKSMQPDNKTEYVLPVPMKEIPGQDKKSEDRMIPSAFTTMSENDLINIINPNCFDQGNTFH